MAGTKDLGQKIGSLRNMQKVMRAMNMIASIKLRKLMPLQEPLMIFSRSLDAVSQDLVNALQDSSHPVLDGRQEVKKVHIILLSADKGLCGSHNSSVQRSLDEMVGQQRGEGREIEVSCIGIKGANYCRRREYEVFQHTEINERSFLPEELKAIGDKIFARFMDDEIQEVHLIYNRFLSTIQQETETVQLLPIPETISGKQKRSGENAVLEPEPADFAPAAGALYLHYRLQAAVKNSLLSEQAARMTAMENATNNSQDLIEKYITLQNRARQADITNELIEIISGKEALKG